MKHIRVIPLLLCGLSLSALAGCDQKIPEPAPEPRSTVAAEPPAPEPPDLIKEDLVVGTGAEAKDGDKVKVHYTGRLLKTNYMFDTSVGKTPLDVTIGSGGVIKGWDLGLVGMKVGGKRKLTIPSKLAYGDQGHPPKIPAKATLVFEVELVQIGDAPDAGAGDAGKDAKKKAGEAGAKGAKGATKDVK